MSKQIPICSCGVPLIWTIAFPGKEYWCPYCGKKFDFLEPEKIKVTDELEKKLHLYREHSQTYLEAVNILAAEKLNFKGKWYTKEDIPQYLKDNAKKIIKNYKYKVVLEESDGNKRM